MSYASFLRNVPEILSQPTGIAALASLGIHGAIAFILPLMPVESSKTNKQATTPKPVGLSELSSSEQSRIPQLSPTTQPGVQSQLPPLPTQIAGLPAQQQLPPTINGASTLLPPTPPVGSLGSSVPSVSSNSTALAPLEKASGLSITRLPGVGNSVPQFRDSLKNGSRYDLTPRISSRITPGISSGMNRNYNSDAYSAYNRQQLQLSRPDRLASVPSTGPGNVAVEPPPLSASDMMTPPTGNTGSNYNNLNNNLNAVQPGNESRVEPNQYIAPVYQNQTVGNNNFKVATGATPLPTYQPQPGGALDNLNRPSGSTTPGIGNNQNTQQNTSDAASEAQRFIAFKKEYPQGELRTPINIAMGSTKLDDNVKVSVIMDGKGKIADFQLSGDAAKLPFPKQQAIRERLQQYFKENPTSTNGKGALFSFIITPQANSTQLGNTGSGALQNQTSGQSPQAPTNGIMNVLSGTQSNSNQPVKAPTVSNPAVNNLTNNTNRTTNSTTTPVLPPALPGPLKPVGTLPQGQVVLPKLPLQKPISSSTTDLPQTLRNVQVAPTVAPTKPVSEQTTTTASQPSRNALVAKLRTTQPSESDSKMSLIEKLRQVKQQREKVNQENSNP